MATADRFILDTRDGVPVTVHRWVPDGDVRAVVNLSHGMCEHARRYARLAAALNEVGIAVYAEDHRGHGQTAATEDELGFFAASRGWATVLDDLHRVTLRARSEQPDRPVFLLGHSMGSFLAQQYLFTFPGEIDGLILSGSNGPIGPLGEVAAALARAEKARIGPWGRSELLENVVFRDYNKAFEPRRTDRDWLSRDEAEVDLYNADPLSGWAATTQFYVDFFAGLRVIGQIDRVRAGAPKQLPIYLFCGSEDPVGGADGQARLAAYYAEAGLTRVESKVYDEGRHEMLNEINRDEVTADLIAWLERHLTASTV